MPLAFVIFGWPKRTKEVGPAYYVECVHCANAVMYWLVKARRWLSLFFVPVLPISSKRYSLVCEVCGASLDVDKGELANAKRATEYVKRLEDGELTEDECFDELERLAAESALFDTARRRGRDGEAMR